MPHKCGLCGKSGKLTRTECCGQWICDDEDEYILFSYARNSCHRNHMRFTLCGFHHTEGHSGDWKTCDLCKKDFETELYAYYGTNEYNFEKLPNPPSYEPTRCETCGKIISLGYDGYSIKGSKYFCDDCSTSTVDMERFRTAVASHEEKKQKRKITNSKIFEGPVSIDKRLFEKLSVKWPAVKWISALLAENEDADKWMLGLLKAFLNDENDFAGKREWPVIHAVRVIGEKRLAGAVCDMIEIYDRHHDEYDRILTDGVLAAMEQMGPPAFGPVFEAFEKAEDDELKITYLGILSGLGVRDERIKKGLLDHYDMDPFSVAGDIAEYGDKALLPFLYEQMRAIIPGLKEQIPTTRDRSWELDIYIELRASIVEMEMGFDYHRSSFSWEDYYRRRGRPVKFEDPEWNAENEKYDEALKEFDRKFLGGEIELLLGDDYKRDEGFEMPDDFVPFRRETPKPGRNDPCPCCSGKKFKKCCLEKMH